MLGGSGLGALTGKDVSLGAATGGGLGALGGVLGGYLGGGYLGQKWMKNLRKRPPAEKNEKNEEERPPVEASEGRAADES